VVEKGVLHAYDIIRPELMVADLFKEIVTTVQREGIPHFAPATSDMALASMDTIQPASPKARSMLSRKTW
jgi:hypothetical protein